MQTSNIPNLLRQHSTSTRDLTVDSIRRPEYSLEQAVFMQRLRDLIAKRAQHVGSVPANDWRMRLIDKALYSTYQDCLALELGDEARAIVRPDSVTAG